MARGHVVLGGVSHEYLDDIPDDHPNPVNAFESLISHGFEVDRIIVERDNGGLLFDRRGMIINVPAMSLGDSPGADVTAVALSIFGFASTERARRLARTGRYFNYTR